MRRTMPFFECSLLSKHHPRRIIINVICREWMGLLHPTKYEIYFYKSENLRRLTLSRRREMRMKLEHKKISKGGGGQLFRGQNIQNLPYASGVGRTYLTARNSFLFEGHLLCPQYPVSSLDDFLSAKSKRYTRYTKRKKCAAPRATMLPTRCPLNSRGARSLPSESGPG